MVCHRCERDMATVSGGRGNVTHDGKPWCGCVTIQEGNIPYRETTYGFDYGAAKVTRIHSDDAKGWVVLGIDTPKHRVQVYVTKTGKVRVSRDGEELEPPAKDSVTTPGA